MKNISLLLLLLLPQYQSFTPTKIIRNPPFLLHATTTDDAIVHTSVSTTPQLLASLWEEIVDGCRTMLKGDVKTLEYPNMKSELEKEEYISKLMAHFDTCKDICDDFGIYTILLPKTSGEDDKKIVTGFTVKSYKNKDAIAAIEGADETGGYKFTEGYDPFWDDDLYIDPSLFEDDEDEEDSDEWDKDLKVPKTIENEVPMEDDVIVKKSKDWVDKLMSDCGVCPFTSGPDNAGLPLGKVRYTVDRSASLEEIYAVYWKEVCLLEKAPSEKEHSTTLLITPEFALKNIELFENFSTTLTRMLEPLKVENLIQIIFFHPLWTFRDGMGDRMGKDRAANYARRSPWPMINLIRTKQVRAAQKGIPTGLVYQQNERTLNEIGASELERMLRLRDWKGLEGHKVDRKQMEALRIAKDMREEVTVEEDLSLSKDSTPAVNKVDRRQIEGGDMVNVIRQALEKRMEGGALNGAETSAVLMASDFLIEELQRVMAGEVVPVKESSTGGKSAAGYPQQQWLDEEDTSQKEEMEMGALFGTGGFLKDSNDDDDSGSLLGSGFASKW